jgi:hypothetical protein
MMSFLTPSTNTAISILAIRDFFFFNSVSVYISAHANASNAAAAEEREGLTMLFHCL